MDTAAHQQRRNQRTRLRLFALGVACMLALLLPGCSASSASSASSGAQAQVSAPVVVKSPQEGASPSQRDLAPARLIIPRMKLDASILALGPDANGNMQAPREGGAQDPIWGEVYWWDVGAAPGATGNAVIAGHVNRPDGSAAAFTKLDALQPGDLIEVVTVGGERFTFRVTEKAALSVYVSGSNDPTMGRIFGPAIGSHLNLMTCWGQWDGTQYNKRLVVFSTLVATSNQTTASK